MSRNFWKAVIRAPLLFLTAVLSGVVLASPTGSPSPQAGRWSSLLDEGILTSIEREISGSLCFEHVRELSRHDRRWGSRDYAMAVDYLAARARAYGLKDIAIERIPIRTGRETFWMHSPGGYLPWECRSGTVRLVEPFPMLISDFESASCTVADHSRSSGITAEVIFVGKGDSAEHYAGLDVHGKIVLAEGGSHEVVHELAVHRHGALGTAVFYRYPAKSLESDGVYWTHILPMSRDGKAKSTFGLSLSTNQGAFLRDLLKKGEKVVVAVDIDADIVPDGTFDLLTAAIPGSTHAEEEFIFYSHLDHPKPGAHDNAAANASILEIGRTLAALIERGIIARPSRTIRFLWMPHMSGLNMYLFRHPEMIGRIRAGCNLDCVGLDQAKYPSAFHVVLPPGSLAGPLTEIAANLVGFFNRKLSGAALEGDLQRLLFAPEGSRNMFAAKLVPYDGGSDEYTANTRSLNIPSLRFFDFPIPPRHSQLNGLDYVDPTTLRRVSYLGAIIAYAYAGMDSESAPFLLNEASYQAKNRMARDLLKAENLLESSGPDAVHEDYRRGVMLLGWSAEKERSSLASLQDALSSGRSRSEMFDGRRHELDDLAASCLSELRRSYEAASRRLSIPALDRTPQAPATPWAAVIPVPNPCIKGSPGYFDTYFEDILGPDYLKKYPKLNPDFTYGSAGYYETLNCMDGRRSVLDIYEAVRSELWSGDYAPGHSLTLEETAEYVRLLNDARVISLKRPR